MTHAWAIHGPGGHYPRAGVLVPFSCRRALRTPGRSAQRKKGKLTRTGDHFRTPCRGVFPGSFITWRKVGKAHQVVPPRTLETETLASGGKGVYRGPKFSSGRHNLFMKAKFTVSSWNVNPFPPAIFFCCHKSLPHKEQQKFSLEGKARKARGNKNILFISLLVYLPQLV
jgi:hypothetical protein